VRQIAGAVVALLLAALPATARHGGADPQAGGTAKPAAQGEDFGALPARRIAAAAARKRAATPPEPARDAAMPLAERIAIQFDLAWTGDYSGLINGEASDRTAAAIKAFQRKRKLKETGVLNDQERASLAAAAKAMQVQVGWRMVDDPVTGVRIGLPARQVPHRRPGPSGTRWSSAQGQVQVETFKIKPGTTLAAIYEQQKSEPSTRKLEVNLLRPDFFILSGMQNLKRFYVRAGIREGEVRGMTVLYDQATEPIMDPVVVVMSNTFVPFPGVTGDAGIAPIAPAPKRKVEYGTGIVVSTAGHILTDRQVTDGCNVIVVSGHGDADRQAEDEGSELALLRVYGAADLVPAAFFGDSVKAGDLMLIGIADPQRQGGGGTISKMPARLAGELLEPAPQLGFSGGAALDAQARFAGMVRLRMPSMATTTVAATGAQPQAILVAAPAVRSFLAGQGLALGAARTSGLDAAKASLVRVICVRK
jgi:peptidoglycan hydrolase-like protein with peptidoglycan-binding domain